MTTMIVAITTIASTNAARCGVGITTAATTCPRGFAKRDQLPPGLERQLRVRGTLPPGLRKKLSPCPEELEGRLPPPPRGCAHVVIGGARSPRSPREPQLVYGVGYFSLREISVANYRGRTGGSLKPSFRFFFGLCRTRRDAHRQSEAASVLREIFVYLRPEGRSFQTQHARLSRGSRLRQRASSTPQEPQLSPRHTSGTHFPLPLGRSYATRRSRRAEFFEPKAMQLQIALSMTPSRPACGT
jgi:hypothetical protein